MASVAEELTVVVMTRNRAHELDDVLSRLSALPEQPAVVVVDNGSDDGTAELVRQRHPTVRCIALPHNAGVAARNLAVRTVSTPYIAFNDDDSWWAPGALARVVELFREHPVLAAVTARIVVEPAGTDDPLSDEMRASPVQALADAPGVPVLGFLACAAAVRRSAFLEAGGFNERFHFGGEEELLAADLVGNGWEVRLVPDVVVSHRPSASRDGAWRRRRGVRNALWFLWLRRPWAPALRRSGRLLASASPSAAVAGLSQALVHLPWVLRHRSVVSPFVERQLEALEVEQARSRTRNYGRGASATRGGARRPSA